MTEYILQFVDGARLPVRLTEEQWFAIFLSGQYKDGRLVCITRRDDPSKIVTFAENAKAS